jgi:murein L,D-transpeptidase YafK
MAAPSAAKEPEKVTRGRALAKRMLAALDLAWPARSPRILVHKADRRLQLFVQDVEVLDVAVGLGGAPEGHKFREGDLRTPEGEYYVCTRNVRSKFHLFLGISYPGPEDAARGLADKQISKAEHDRILEKWEIRSRPPWNTDLGGMIGVHGYGAGSDWTLGCVAVDDEWIEALWAMCPLGTPVEIKP